MNLSAYFPRVVTEWRREMPKAGARVFDGSLVFMDVSGFTAMSERLAKSGKIGAEEVTDVLDSTFTLLLEAAYERGGSLLKFGGDAMLLFFAGPNHPARACASADSMRALMRKHGRFQTSAGAVRLGMSVGVHSGPIHMFLVGSSHVELFVTGPAVTRVVEMEGAANAGEIRITEQTGLAIPASCTKSSANGGLLLVKAPPLSEVDSAAPPLAEANDAEQFVPLAIRKHLLDAGSESEHRHAVVSFVHFEGIDSLLEHDGVPAVEKALKELVQEVQAAVDEVGICFLSTDIDRDGGKIILTGGVPTTSGEDEEAMLRAVSRIRAAAQPLPLRIGVHSGPVFAGDVGPPYRRTFTVIGDVVNLAARLMSRAESGQIIATPAIPARARTRFETEQLEPFLVKGKSKPVAAVAVRAVQREQRSVDARQQLPLVGREQELHLLLATLDSVKHRQRTIVDLVGEAGMGKSRIVQELRTHAGDMAAHVSACEPYETSTPYFPLRRLFRSVLAIEAGADPDLAGAALEKAVRDAAPDLLEWLPLIAIPLEASVPATEVVDRLEPRFRRNQLHRVVAEVIARVSSDPTLFVIEDSHWMDDASRELLADLLASFPDMPWMFIFTRQPECPAPFADLVGASVTIRLEPLSPAASQELTAIVVGDKPIRHHDMEALIDRAGGNPLFLREIAAAVGSTTEFADLPTSVEALLVAQVDRLPGHARRVLRFASVVGSTFHTGLLQESLDELLDVSVADACEELADFLVDEGRGTFRFRHALIRETAYNGLPFRLRLRLHDRLGRSIERRHDRRSDTRAELLSLHFDRAHNYEKAFQYSRIAAERSKRKSANVEAATFYHRAIDSARRLGNVPQRDLAELYESLSDVGELAANYDVAADALSHARRLNVDAADAFRLLRKEGVIRERLGRYSQALRWYGRALHANLNGARPQDIHALRLAYAGIRFRQGRYAECAGLCRQVISEAEAAADRASLAHAYYLLDHAYTMLGSPEAGTYRQLALPIFVELDDYFGQANVLNNLGVSATIDGDWDEGVRLFERSRAARERIGDVVGAATATNNIGEVALDRGNLDEAEQLFREALRIWRGANYAIGVAVATSALGLAAVRAGRVEEAASLLSDARDRFSEIRAESFVIETDMRIAELHLSTGNPEHANDSIEGVFERADIADLGPSAVALFRLRGLVYMHRGGWGDARTALDESIHLARTMSAQYELALSLAARARIAELTGEDPTPYLKESAPIVEQLGLASIPLIDSEGEAVLA